jgi:succinyl-CoA synthetase beta subunit
MFLLEHDGKTLLSAAGLPVPPGILVTQAEAVEAADLPRGPWMVKAQVSVGGRGKAGGIRRAESMAEVRHHVQLMIGSEIRGAMVRSCRIEQLCPPGREVYVSLGIAGPEAGVRVLLAERGGIEIEGERAGAVQRRIVAPDPGAVLAATEELAGGVAPAIAAAVRSAGSALVTLFFEAELGLLEINPLFVLDDGGFLLADAKIATDDGALPRQPRQQELLERRAEAYPEAFLKWREGYDFVVIDPQGSVGLLTTGAGLSMMVNDELAARGLRPFNFCDIRSGQFRGKPDRLIAALRRMAAAGGIKVALLNIFGGITHLGEVASLFERALAAVPEVHFPLVVRLIGNGEDAAEVILMNSPERERLIFESDLEKALEHVARLAGETA